MSFTKQNKYNILRLRDVEILCRGKENCPTFYTLKKIYLNGHPVNVKEKYKYNITSNNGYFYCEKPTQKP